MKLSQLKCVSCGPGAVKASRKEVGRLSREVGFWRIVKVKGVERLERVFEFKDFMKALAFTNKVGKMAESQDHHPAITTEWGKVTVAFWTHKVKGLHLNDFIAAAKTDRLY